MRLGALDLWFKGLPVDPVQLFETRTHLEDMFTTLAVSRASPDDVFPTCLSLGEFGPRASSVDVLIFRVERVREFSGMGSGRLPG